MNNAEISKLNEVISKIEKTEVESDGRILTIKEIATQREKASIESKKHQQSPILSIISTALVINWREATAQKRVERFKKKYYNKINTLEKLNEIIQNTKPEDFIKEYLDINPNKEKPEHNPKYRLLKSLCIGFISYRNHFKFKNDIDAMIDWADKVDVKNLKNDFIGKLNGVGIGVVQNLKLTLGYNVIKPDRNVLNVLRKEFNIIVKPEYVDEIPEKFKLSNVYFDALLFEYGKYLNLKKHSKICI